MSIQNRSLRLRGSAGKRVPNTSKESVCRELLPQADQGQVSLLQSPRHPDPGQTGRFSGESKAGKAGKKAPGSCAGTDDESLRGSRAWEPSEKARMTFGEYLSWLDR